MVVLLLQMRLLQAYFIHLYRTTKIIMRKKRYITGLPNAAMILLYTKTRLCRLCRVSNYISKHEYKLTFWVTFEESHEWIVYNTEFASILSAKQLCKNSCNFWCIFLCVFTKNRKVFDRLFSYLKQSKGNSNFIHQTKFCTSPMFHRTTNQGCH